MQDAAGKCRVGPQGCQYPVVHPDTRTDKYAKGLAAIIERLDKSWSILAISIERL